jgi:hypothetical protein
LLYALQEQISEAARGAIETLKASRLKGGSKMKWGRQIDYHGSRSYGADAPAFGRFSLIAAWLANALTGKNRKRPSVTISLDGERGYSWLGGTPARSPRARPADCPFPTRPGALGHAGDSRVLP